MVKQQKKSKQPMKVRNIEDLGINTQTGDMLSRALKIYNSPATSYKLPFTLGKPQNNPTVMAMDACINHIIDMCAPEWQALAVPRFLGYPMLSNIAQDPLIRSGIEVIVDDMTRKFIDLTSKGENDLSTSIAELESDLQSFQIKSIFNRALATTGYQGGCLVYVDVGELDDEEKKTPLYLDAATFKKGSFRGLRIIEPINLYPGRYDTLDPTSEDYFNPETWFVLGKEYHRSRFLYFAQNEVPLILKPLYNFFGISLAQQVLEYVQNFTENRRSAQRLLNKFSLTIWRTDMSQFLSGGDCNSLTQRVKYFNAQRSNDGTVLLDKETEEMEQINTPLSGVTDIVSMSLDLAPVILGISKDKYFGDLPKGLNASSEGTNRIYYDKIQSLNEKICYDNVVKVLKILQLRRNIPGGIMTTVSSLRKPNTTASDYNSLSFTILQQLAQVNTLELVIVVAVNADMTLDVKPLLNALTPDNEAVEPAVIYNIPYLRIQSGQNAFKITPQVGDIGLVGYCQRDITGVLLSKGQANPQSNRKFSNSDGIYLCSVASLAQNPVRYMEINDNQITINGDVPLVVNVSEATINAPTTINGDLTINGKVTSTGDVVGGKISLQTHQHTGVTPGDKNTGTPI